MKAALKPVLMMIGSGLAAAALAAGAWVSVPSTPLNDRLVLRGGNLGAYGAVTLRIEHPGGFVRQQAAVADAQGNLLVEYPLDAYGGYGVKVFDAAGKEIGGGRLGHFR